MSVDYKRLPDDHLLGILVSEQAAAELIKTHGTLEDIFLHSCPEELSQVKGMGSKRASQVCAAGELYRRIAQKPSDEKTKIRSPKDVTDIVQDMRFLKTEHMRVLYLNTKNQVIGAETVTSGTVNSCLITPREVFSRAVRLLCTGVIIVHNHPSGDPTPSNEDIEVTRRIVEAGKCLGIPLLDHIIIANNNFVSLKEQGVV